MEPFTVLCNDELDKADENHEKWQFALAIPVIYIGATVTAAVFAMLVAKYGAEAVRRAGVRQTSIHYDLSVKEHFTNCQYYQYRHI